MIVLFPLFIDAMIKFLSMPSAQPQNTHTLFSQTLKTPPPPNLIITFLSTSDFILEKMNIL